MRFAIASRIMPRTTIDILAPVLAEAKALARESERSLGEVVSELMAEALSRRAQAAASAEPAFRWIARSMGGARVDLDDKEALYALLDEERADKVAEP